MLGVGGAIPLPFKGIIAGLPTALCAMLRLAVFAPTDCGVNVTFALWGAPPASMVKDEGVTLNSA